MTYAEENGEKPFDWKAFLNRAASSKLSDKDWSEAEDLAGSWVTCACGNMCDVIPRYADGEPVDMILSYLGSEFLYDIKSRHIGNATRTLSDIEALSTYLIQQLTNDPQTPQT